MGREGAGRSLAVRASGGVTTGAAVGTGGAGLVTAPFGGGSGGGIRWSAVTASKFAPVRRRDGAAVTPERRLKTTRHGQSMRRLALRRMNISSA